MDKESKERKLSFKCCIPSNMSDCTDDELRISLVTLKNARTNVEVCIGRLERELKRRGSPTSYLESMREAPSSELLELAMMSKE